MARTRSWLALGTGYVFLLGTATAATFPSIPGFPFPQAAPAAKLPALKADADQTTTSGVSSGAYMALQLVVSSSSKFRGAGLIAGGPWHCAGGSAQTAQTTCMKNPTTIDVAALVEATRDAAKKGEIDQTSNLARAKFFVFGGTKDTVVVPPAADRVKEYLSAFTPPQSIEIEASIPAAHGWATENFGNACSKMGIPWMNKCGYDTASHVLGRLYGKLQPKVKAEPNSLTTFDQTEFDQSGSATLGAFGFLYAPKSCVILGKCRVHVALHGCQMSADFVQDTFAVNSGLNEWAESNEVIVLFPQVKSSGGNPYGCWDWFGYTGASYDTLNGEQVRAIKAMVDRLTSP